MKSKNKSALMVFFMLVLFSTQAQIPFTVPLHHFTQIKNSQIYDIAEFDKEIYIATSRGLFKYNGQELYAFSLENGLKDDEVFNFQVYDNKLWFNSITGRLYYMFMQTNDIKEFTLFLQDYIKTFFWHKETLYYTNNKSELCVWKPEYRAKKAIKSVFNVLDYKVKENDLYLLHADFEYSILSTDTHTFKKNTVKNTVGMGYTIPIRNRNMNVQNDIYTFFRQKLAQIHIHNQTLQEIPIQDVGTLYTIYPTENSILIGTQNGLYQYKNQKTECIISNLFVTNIIKDSEDTFWITTFNGEIYTIPDIEIQTIFYSDKNIASNMRKVHVFDNKVICGTNTGEILVNHQILSSVKKNYEAGKLNRILSINSNQDKVYITRDDGFFIYDLNKKNTQYVGTRYTIKKLLLTDTTYYIIGAYYSVALMDKKTKQTIKKYNCSRVADVIMFNHKPFLCTYDKVYFIEKDSLNEVLNNQYKENKIRFAYYDTLHRRLYIAHQKGIHIYNTQLQLLKNIHLDPNYIINKIQVHKEQVYIASQLGLFVMNTYTDNLIPIQNLHNLSIYDIFIYQDILHFVSDAGYGNIPIKKLNYTLPNFSVEYKFKEKYLTNHNQMIQLRYPDNILELIVIPKTIKFRYAINFTYKIMGNPSEENTKYNLLAIPLVQSGVYYLNIKTNIEKNNIHQDTLKIKYTLPIWKDRNFKIFISVIVAIIGLLAYMRHLIQKEKQKSYYKKQEIENLKLQLQAVQSRLNPHFIFNGLQSLQYLVVSKQNDLTRAYLNDFAALTRKFLNYSQKEFCTTEEEIAILKHYLNLENIAHDNKVKYTLNTEVEDEIILTQPIIPSLILQPLVENIFKHAFTEDYLNPCIEIRFIENIQQNNLIIEIEDNGVGISSEVFPHSKGLLLIQERLKIINQTYKTKHTIDIKKAEKYPTGTLCRLILQFNPI